ncbi:MAG: YbgA family protein [Methylococcales bacterium]
MSKPCKIKIGISACLLGFKVRHDGRDKSNALVNETWNDYFEFVPVCPEVDSGMSVPREAIQLVRTGNATVKALGVHNPQLDVTADLTSFSHARMNSLGEIRGFLVKSKSPSCGLERIPVFSEHGPERSFGVGLFTSVLIETYPLLPVEQEDKLGDPIGRDNFLERVMVYDRWRTLLDGAFTVAKLIDFHSDYKLLVWSHDQAAYRRLGRHVAKARPGNLQQSARSYAHNLMNALKIPADRNNHFNVLQHLAGYLKPALDAREKKRLHSMLETYKTDDLPLIAPVSLMLDLFRRFPNPYVTRQVYLDWHADSHAILLQNRRSIDCA